MVKKFHVTLVKYAGIDVFADTEEEASEMALDTNEDEYEYGMGQEIWDNWDVTYVEEVEDGE